ncbi:hypothetical protein LELG_05262 [Lodderomyces elongisporus NRRL YB-4239]|uniref:Restriction of telomere capping protein 1 n=1 Tax=Lodderomyces elongisporus (strain ATCC 11503 / CBS 2605 / JCM 1781 / NBRC 1676 / NRRL YB-4239) TaxID=379508 RepID=RTC1_LODEL|nr:RecName: Full=Restriction of telomere capping protein 1 [Lodderomyces elongisporus NRRL YB-4239]EDK47081.1 hypothetical protein LELG_05262 [Lodderomyces elongisporus NRRL YB-4239]
MAQDSQGQQQSLAKFAFNIYGTLGTPQSSNSPSANSSISSHKSSKRLSKNQLSNSYSRRLTYNAERDVQAIGQLNCGIQISHHISGNEPSHHAVIGGKNYLRLLCLNRDQQQVLQEIDLLDVKSIYRSRNPNKISSVNTIKTRENTIACGMSNGTISMYKVSPYGKGTLHAMLSDHRRTVNSIDFIDSTDHIISGSQDGSIKLWDLRASPTKPVFNLQANLHNDPIRACQYSPHSVVRNKTCILSVHDSGALCKFDLRSGSGSNMYSPDRKWNLHAGPVLSLHIHPEKEYVATGGRDHKICVFNYSEGRSLRTTPENIINTYGSILKVRWSSYLVNQGGRAGDGGGMGSMHTSTSFGDSTLALTNYDLACLYLNDDPTVTIYNLNRKYIPKQIINPYSQKAISNFMWAQNEIQGRRIWTLNKANQFMAYDLDSNFDTDIKRPLDDLPPIGMSWNDNDDFIWVNQAKDEFEANFESMCDDEQFLTDTAAAATATSTAFTASTSTNTAIAAERASSFDLEDHDHKMAGSSLGTSPIERPSLTRSYTHNPMSQFMTKSPSPILRSGTGVLDMTSPPSAGSALSTSTYTPRPKLARNPSQTTQGSAGSFGSTPASSSFAIKYKSGASGPGVSGVPGGPGVPGVPGGPIGGSLRLNSMVKSPFAFPVELPFNDEEAFKFLATEYLVTTPEGFTLADTCLMNASVAHEVGAYQSSQVWRVLAISLSDEKTMNAAAARMKTRTTLDNKNHVDEPDSANADHFNAATNMSATTDPNITAVSHTKHDQEEDVDSFALKSIQSDLDNVVGSYNSNSTLSIKYGRNINPLSSVSSHGIAYHGNDVHSRTNSMHHSRANSFNNTHSVRAGSSGADDHLSVHSQSNPLAIDSTTSKRGDYELENTNLMNSIFLRSSPNSIGFGSSRSYSSLASSPIDARRALPERQVPPEPLELNHDTSLILEKKQSNHSPKLPKRSGLSIALKNDDHHDCENDYEDGTEAWSFKSLLKGALEYAASQGEITFVSTIAILFYELARDIITFDQCLGWLGEYVEILQRKCLFVEATKIINFAPLDVAEKLKTLYAADTIRLYCSHCLKLLTNEKSKRQTHGEFGYWYCDECLQRQLNCVFCNEPCKGLVVAISLKCGHRGHFGCLKEWFIDEQNVECPGGCDVPIVV